METIPTPLIEKALELTWKNIYYIYDDYAECSNYSIEKFFVYLLSPSFIDKYYEEFWSIPWYKNIEHWFWEAIYSYQSGDSSQLINLLEKI